MWRSLKGLPAEVTIKLIPPKMISKISIAKGWQKNISGRGTSKYKSPRVERARWTPVTNRRPVWLKRLL